MGSVSKKKMRRSHHRVKQSSIVEDKKSGEFRLSKRKWRTSAKAATLGILKITRETEYYVGGGEARKKGERRENSAKKEGDLMERHEPTQRILDADLVRKT